FVPPSPATLPSTKTPTTIEPADLASEGSHSSPEAPSSLLALPQSERALAFLEQQLYAAGTPEPKDLIKAYEKFLKVENHRIRLKHYSGKGGREICGQRAGLVDLVVRHLVKRLCAQGHH